MKRLFLCISFLAGAGMSSFAQQNGNQVSPMKIYKMPESEQKPELTKEQEIENCKNLLEALDIKEAWIRSNPEELQKAIDSGWFVNAEKTRAELKARIEELESK